MATTIIDKLRWFNYGGTEKLTPQTIPSHEELIALGAEESGETIRDGKGARNDFEMPEGRDERVYWIDSKECSRTTLTYVPDPHGWYIEDLGGKTWRPADLDDLRLLMNEMDHQYQRYGDLL